MEEPPGEAWDPAQAITVGSESTCLRRTDWSRRRKPGFSVKLAGVGGIAVVVPSASSGVGGSVGRSERTCPLGAGNVYWAESGQLVGAVVVGGGGKEEEIGDGTMCGLFGSVDTDLKITGLPRTREPEFRRRQALRRRTENIGDYLKIFTICPAGGDIYTYISPVGRKLFQCGHR